MWKPQGKWEAESIVNSYSEGDTVVDSSYHFIHLLPAQQLFHVQKDSVSRATHPEGGGNRAHRKAGENWRFEPLEMQSSMPCILSKMQGRSAVLKIIYF